MLSTYQLEALTEKLKDERILNGLDVCEFCSNGDHEVAGNAGCECPCHQPLRPTQLGEIQTLSFQGSDEFSRRGDSAGVPWSANENPVYLKRAGEDDARQPGSRVPGSIAKLPGSVQSTLEF